MTIDLDLRSSKAMRVALFTDTVDGINGHRAAYPGTKRLNSAGRLCSRTRPIPTKTSR